MSLMAGQEEWAMREPLTNLLAVATGGGFGAIFRYLTILLGVHVFGTRFPFGTVMVNLVGCLIAGILVGLMEQRAVLSPTVELLIFTGFLGAFTTLSTFSVETIALFRDGSVVLAMTNVMLNAVLGIVMVAVGMVIARVI
jgi:CrcB protein